MAPKWFQLIKAHHDCYGVALTLPFLIGSLRGRQDTTAISPETAKNHIQALLHRFQTETPDGCTVRIYHCSDLQGQPVATIHYPDEELPSDSLFPTEGGRALAVSAELALHKPFSITELTERLYRHFASDICAARFSYQRAKKSYTKFTPEDNEFITCSISS